MNQIAPVQPKKRINSIDALRGFALFGILMFHCMEHFDLMIPHVIESPFWQSVDNIVFGTFSFLFAGKSYAIFSLLFGLSFFMQMDSQAQKGNDFRLRFVWRLIILLLLGFLNGIIYMGEFFVVYAMLGIVLIPLYKVPTKWLLAISILLFIQIPDVINFISLLKDNTPHEPTKAVIYMDQLYAMCPDIYANGSFTDVLDFNVWKGQIAKLLWTFNNSRYLQLIGLFILGMLIGRAGIHKSEEKMIKYSRMALPYGIISFAVFYIIILLLPHMGIDGYALQAGTNLFKLYGNLGMMIIYVSGLTLLYYNTKLFRKGMDILAPVGRMSVTNYMAQSVIGVCLFYGFGANLAVELSFLQCMFVGLIIFAVQMLYSNWWIRRFYYGPIEWLWRMLTWFKHVPLRRERK